MIINHENPGAGITFTVAERHIYGSSRVGMNTTTAELTAATALPDTGNFVHAIGKKQFELSNHLGNVLSSISDKLIAKDWNNDQTVDSYKAEILFSQDYTPFGVKMDGRTFANSYRYSFNGKETDDETGIQDYGFRMYNVLLGRFLSVDPLAKSYPHNSTFAFCENRVIDGIDLDGLEYITYKVTFASDKTTVTKIEVVKDYRLQENFDYQTYSESFGPEGRGIKYIYEYTDEKGTVIGSEVQWQIRQSELVSNVGRHGLYMGAGCITYTGPLGKGDDYNFTMPPIDEVDAAAKAHDIRDSKLGDGRGWLEDTGLLESDRTLLKDFQDYTKTHSNGEKDKYTGRPASKEALDAAKQGAIFFGMVVRYKEWKVEQEKLGKTVSIDDYKGGVRRAIERSILKKAATDTPK